MVLRKDYVNLHHTDQFIFSTDKMPTKGYCAIIIILSVLIPFTVTAEAMDSKSRKLEQSLSSKSLSKLFEEANICYSNGDKHNALVLYNAVANRYSDILPISEKRNCAVSLYHSGDINYKLRLYSASMNSYLEGLRICDKWHFDTIAANIYVGIGNLYCSQGDYQMGIHFNRKALAIGKAVGNKALQNKALNNLVGASCFDGKIKDGKQYYSLLTRNREQTRDYQYNLLMCQGLLAASTHDYPKAIKSYTKATDYARRNGMEGGYIEAANSCMAHLYDEKGEPRRAIGYLKRNETMARATSQADLLAETLSYLSDIYAKTGDKAEAMDCKAEYLNLADSIYNKEEFNAMKNAQFLYEYNKSDNAIRILKEEKQTGEQKIRIQQWGLFGLTCGFVIFVGLLIAVYRQKMLLRHAYNELYDRSHALIDSETSQKHIPADRPTTKPNIAEHGTTLLLNSGQREALLSDILCIMENTDNFCRSDFSIDSLAEMVGSNSRYVSEAINEEYGKNFRTFLNEYRIKEAMARLGDSERYGNYTIKAISESVGYKSQANFISVFTKITGMKPSIYQKISRERSQ